MALANDKALRFQRVASRLDDAGRWARDRSAKAAALVYEATRSTQFVESWANLTAGGWSSTTAVQVSAGKMYGAGNGAGSGINRGLGIAAGGAARAQTTISIPSASASGGVMIGVSSGAAGSAPTGGGASARALYFGVGGVYSINNGVQSAKLGDYGPGDWTVTVSVDANGIAITGVGPVGASGFTEFRAEFSRSDFNVSNLFLFNSDARQLTGMAVGPLGMTVNAISTVTPRAGIEDVRHTVLAARSGQQFAKLTLPSAYDPRIPRPLVIMWHGSGSDRHVFSDNAAQKATQADLLAAGFAVLTANNSNTATWGAQLGVDTYTWAYRWASSIIGIGPVAFFANSMGSIEALVALSQQAIPGVVAYVGHSPTANLAHAHANPTFTNVIRTAYGIASDGSDYAAKTAGFDPLLMDGRSFRGLPMLFLAATDDTVIPKVENTDKLIQLVSPFATKIIDVPGITGGHSFTITPYTSQIVAFLQDYAGA